MPTLDVSELNIIIAVLGAFTILYGLGSVKIKQIWYLGEALPALLVGIILGPIAAKFIDSERWGSSVQGQTEEITLGITRVVIGIQLVMAGYQLPAKYPWHRWKDMALLLIPVMTIMWLCTTGCIKLMIPKLTTLTAMVIASLVTSTDPVLSQAIAKGPFADKYVPRALREIISAEAGSNDGFGFPFLLLATYLIRHAPEEDVNFKPGVVRIASNAAHRMFARAADVGRLGGGAGQAVEIWIVEGWLYFILLGAVVGAVLGVASMYAVTFTLKKKWIDTESLLLYPTALGLFTIGVTGLAGLDDLLACFCAGSALNWNGTFLREALSRHDEVNSSIDVLLNFGGFMYIGAILPWSEFNSEITGITYGRLLALGLLVLLLRRIPAMMVMYRLMPNTVKTWQEALFMGYFGPIGIGAVFYVEHARHLYPKLDAAETHEEEDLLRAMGPVVYFLVLFSIVVHGLSIPALEIIYRWRKIEPIIELDPSVERRRSVSEALPPNSHVDPRCGSVDEDEKEGPRIQFLDERELRSPRSAADVRLGAGDKDCDMNLAHIAFWNTRKFTHRLHRSWYSRLHPHSTAALPRCLSLPFSPVVSYP
ncbi:Sodium/hydrogen exchanger family-domain-containing protein [Boeremia exigua]|uniref:Sodium/hydrogen exchanger family-domain-containing protein n=1 Tax=Boeremia exigua TaxID=749465 RepID=UPI001E8E3443|nr:Sodium/hydrogen exchanger family-domain-containing protein [Boeremia exigua]KAH6618489.1 Sodium/hydrogen exchanger family-domain-containing protein [Boeremia exigua]